MNIKKNIFNHNFMLWGCTVVSFAAMGTIAGPAAAQTGYSWVFQSEGSGGTTANGSHIGITDTTSGGGNNAVASGTGSESPDGSPTALGTATALALAFSPVVGGMSTSTSASSSVSLAFVTLQATYENAQGQTSFPQQGLQFSMIEDWMGSNMAAASYTTSQSGVVTPNGSASTTVRFAGYTMVPGPTIPSTGPGLYSTSPTPQAGGIASANNAGGQTTTGFTRSDSGLVSRLRGQGGIVQNGRQVWGENTDMVGGMLYETETYTLQYFSANGGGSVSEGLPVTVTATANAGGGGSVGVGYNHIMITGSAH